ncbi:Zn(2)-Cys(6) binuclear cluster domain-containing protein [Lentinula aciculospora]|uniref:Zn(2)-Cys(6) binuclear cluster domain-containing protein n=1 Tax=Lentinula aciculospora TaxID=153920 RepID=A0A9W9AQA0_9AGAR|nr:Zn(2)-Cys(6) binuclear cluster domain-containing protein [Lentinula aciculospora]
MTSERVPSSSKLTNSPYSLQRGKACSNCRKRKIKCDGLRPTCTQCLRSARPGDACEYADSGRTRTQMLEDNISRLEARIRELEEPDDENAVRLHLPYSFSSQSSPALIAPPSTGSSIRSSTLSSPIDTQRSSNSPSIASSSGHSSTHSAFEEEPSSDVVQQLLMTFLPHALDMGFFLNLARFQNSALLPLPLGHFSRPCAGLLSAVYLLGLHLSGDADNQEHVYLARALAHTANILSSTHPHRIIHAIQAEILLSVYFFRTGRILEGKYHMSAAVSLTLGAQLHKIRASPTGSGNIAIISLFQQFNVAGPLLTPPSDQIEEGERINAFWMVYTLSNCWGVAVGTLSSAVFESHGSTIDTPWPLDMADYEQVMWNTPRETWNYGADFGSLHTPQELLPAGHQSIMTVQNFFRQVPSSSVKEFSVMAMFAKSSILLDRAANLASLYRHDMNADEASRFGASFSSLDNLISNFQSSLGFLPLNQHTSYDFGTILAAHTLAYCATIQLHSVFINTNSHSRRTALSATRACVSFLRQVDMSRASHINAVLGSCWTSVCQVLIDEIQRMRRISAATGGVGMAAGGSHLHSARTESWGIGNSGLESSSEDEMQLVGMLEKVFATMAVFSVESPLIGYQLAKIQEAFQSI